MYSSKGSKDAFLRFILKLEICVRAGIYLLMSWNWIYCFWRVYCCGSFLMFSPLGSFWALSEHSFPSAIFLLGLQRCFIRTYDVHLFVWASNWFGQLKVIMVHKYVAMCLNQCRISSFPFWAISVAEMLKCKTNLYEVWTAGSGSLVPSVDNWSGIRVFYALWVFLLSKFTNLRSEPM